MTKHLAAAALALVAAQPPVAPPTLEAVLARAAAYLGRFQAEFAGVVAEETYEQNVRPSPARRPGTPGTGGLGGPALPRRRTLESDLLLVKPPDADRWVQFRDVYEVDGRRVRNRDDRLVQLFIHPPAGALDQIRAIQQESARYNIGLQRTTNVPVLALIFLTRQNQSRSAFSLAGPDDGGVAVDFRETAPDTLIRTGVDADIPSHGRFWIDPADGRVLKTQLITEDTTLRAEVDVTYGPEPGLDILVPVEMEEHYTIRLGDERVDGKATYSHFRRFQVSSTTEPVAPAPRSPG